MAALEKATMNRRRALLEHKGVVNWTVEDVAEWVEAIGYPQYCSNFKENDISGR